MFNSLLVMASLTCPGCEVNTNTNYKCFECDEDKTNETNVKLNQDNHKPLRNKSSKKNRRKHLSTVDSGATIHCIKDKHLFTNLDTNHKVRLKVANGKIMTGEGVGTCVLKLNGNDGKLHDVILHNCVYSPNFSNNLISCRRLWRDSKISSHFDDRNYLKCKMTGTKFYFNFNNSFKLESFRATHELNFAEHCDSATLHSRFNHASPHKIRKLLSNSTGINVSPSEINQHDHDDCTGCKTGGARRLPFHKSPSQKFTYFGERISSDLCGPFTKSVDGYKYSLCFVDSATNKLKIYLLKDKSAEGVKASFKSFLEEFKHHLPKDNKPVRWHTDNGGEFMSTDLDEFCNEFAIKRSFSVPYCPPQNAHAERMWGLLLRPMRIMLAQSGVHEKFWSYAMLHACNVHNIMPSSKLPNEISPYEALYGEPPDVSKFRVWGCISYYLVPDHELKSKLSPRAWAGVHLGFDAERKGYLIYIPHNNKIVTGYHVTFQEQRFMNFHENGISNLPKIPKPLKDKKSLYKEPRDHTRPTLPPHVDRPSSYSDRGSDSDDDNDDDDHYGDHSNDDENPYESDYDRIRRQKVIDKSNQRETRVGTYGRNPIRTGRNPNPNYTEIIIEDVNNQSFR